MQRVVLVLICVAALGAVWWFGFRGEDGPPPGAPGRDDRSAEGGSSADPAATEDAAGPELAAVGQRVAPAQDAPAHPEADGLVVTGRLLDERRRPVAGAEILISAGYDSGQYGLGGTTGAEGRFRISGLRPPRVWGYILVRAHLGDRAAQAINMVGIPRRREIPVGELVLGPAHALEVQVVNERGEAIGGARIVLEARRGVLVSALADVVADDSGTYRFEGLPASGYRVIAIGAGQGRGCSLMALPQREADPVVVTVGAERSLVAVVTDKDSGEPIAGALVLVEEVIQRPGTPGNVVPWLPPMPYLLTDVRGRVAIPSLGLRDRMQAGAEAKGYDGRGGTRMMRSVPLEDTEVRIQLRKQRQLRFPLAKENPHAPPEGTVLEVIASPDSLGTTLPRSARIEEGHIVAEGCCSKGFYAQMIAPGGAWAHVYATRDGARDREVVFEKPRKIVVILTNADGTPAEGHYISVRNQGNMVIVEPVRLGPEGRVALLVRYAHLVDILASATPAPHEGKSIGSVNLKDQDGGTIEASLPSGRKVSLTITVDGEARLPPSFLIRGAMHLTEDPEAGVVRFELPGDVETAQKARILARGFLPHEFEIPAGAPGATARVAVALSRGGTILLKLRPPADGHSNVQIVAPEDTAYGSRGRGLLTITELGEEQGWTLRRMGPYAPGPYVASDAGSQARSEAFAVTLGRETVVELDLSKVGVVRGRVQVPEGYDFKGARVRLQREDMKPDPRARSRTSYVRSDGTFAIRVPGNKPVTLRVFHPKLVVGATGGAVEVTEPREGIVLKLIAGGTARFTVAPPLDARTSGGRGRSPVDVLLYAGEPKGKPTHAVNATPDGAGYKLAGFEPGTYAVVVSARKRAPASLGKLTLGADTDLGVVKLPKGGRVRIKVRVLDGQDPPRIYANATCTSGAAYTRYINSSGEQEVLLEGLGAGTFELYVMPMSGFSSGGSGKGSIRKTIECDGSEEIVLEMDLR